MLISFPSEMAQEKRWKTDCSRLALQYTGSHYTQQQAVVKVLYSSIQKDLLTCLWKVDIILPVEESMCERRDVVGLRFLFHVHVHIPIQLSARFQCWTEYSSQGSGVWVLWGLFGSLLVLGFFHWRKTGMTTHQGINILKILRHIPTK